jgi:TnpA family transposase
VPRYFGRGRGVTFYVWTSDQHTHYATRVVRTTVRDATYVLDGILDNQTELPIEKHTTDTAGYSDIIFALFDLLGLQFAPRLAGLPDRRLYRLASAGTTPASTAPPNRDRPPHRSDVEGSSRPRPPAGPPARRAAFR